MRKRLPLVLVQRGERSLERPVAALEPPADTLGGERVQVDHRPAPVVDVLAAADEAELFEVARQLARRRQRQSELVRQLADRPLPLAADLGEDGDVPPGQAPVAVGDGEQVVARAAPLPEPAHHAAQVAAELVQLAAFAYHRTSVIIM